MTTATRLGGRMPGADQVEGLAAVLDLVRFGVAGTRPELARASGLGRSVVAQRAAQLLDSGLIVETGLASSTGGRAARRLRLRAEAGCVVVASLGATSMHVALTDLAGTLLAERLEPTDIGLGPEVVLGRVEELVDDILTEHAGAGGGGGGRGTGGGGGAGASAGGVWGMGIGVPGPVEFATGRPVAPPIMPGWDGYPVRQRFSRRYGVSAWVDNDVNVMALGELRAGVAAGERDVVFVKVGSGIGAGLITSGRLHRGDQGAAGDIGHVAVGGGGDVVCRCGNAGCLEAVAGGYALGRRAAAAAKDGSSPFLGALAESGRRLEARDVATGAAHGDPFCVELLVQAGHQIGGVLATVVNFYNPSLIVLGGGVSGAGDLLLAAIRESIYRRSLPLATRNLRIVRSSLGHVGGAIGAAALVVDELLARPCLGRWLGDGSPAGRSDLSEASALG